MADDEHSTADAVSDTAAAEGAEAFEYDGMAQSPVALVTAGLLGAAIGAGLGLLASRALAAEVPSYGEQARRHAARAGREVARRVERVGRGGRRGRSHDAEDALETVAAAARALGRTRDEIGDRVDRELRALRKLVRRGRRRGWLR